MKPSNIASALTSLITAHQPVMIWGPPGVGKSQTVKQVADKMFGSATTARGKKKAPYANGHFIDLRLPLLDSVDLRGIPTVENGRTVWLPPAFLPRDGEGLLFLDEIVQAPTIVQSAASSLVLDRRIGEYVLPDGWAVIAAGNRETDRAATNKMPSHLANRFTHLQYDVHLEDWVTWALTHDVEPAVIAFLNFRPELLHKFDPSVKAFPTPRSWEFVSRIMKQGMDDECFMETIAGTVGEAAATEFIGFFRVFRSLPDYEDICKHPDSAQVPDNAAALYAVTGMITGRGQCKDAKPIFQYVERLPKDFQVLTYRDITKRNVEMAETQGYINWTVKNQAILLNR
jgi:DNA polymerase III delta prime subunit